jgi:putative DNA primase/helicase
MKVEHAKHYAQLGWYVFPVQKRGKKPLVSDWPNRATTDQDQIRSWWQKWPNANIGIACGPSRLVVIDVDPKNGGDVYDLPVDAKQLETVTSLTSSGGIHLYYSRNGQRITNSSGRLPKGIDVRGVGGYVVAPGSVHPSGEVYSWEVSSSPEDSKILPLPKEIENLLVDTSSQAPPVKEGDIPKGRRDQTLASLAGSLRRRGASQAAILAALVEENKRCSPPLNKNEVQRIAKSISRYQPADNNATRNDENDFGLTDLGNAKRLVDLFGQDLKYCHPWARWYSWDGSRWEYDRSGQVVRFAKETARSILSEAASIDDKSRRRELAQHAMRSESESRIQSMLSLARSEEGIPVLPEDLDQDSWLLNCANGTIDLKNGNIREHRREDLITKGVPVALSKDIPALWLAFLERIFKSNQNLIDFMQRAVGYCLTGGISERCFFICYGSGANGKTVFLETIRAILGDYSKRTPTETLLAKRSGAIPNDLARLKGARFVTASESEEGRRLAESSIKDLTGGDVVTARFMRAEFFEFKPEFKLWLATNHKPVVKGTDDGVWSRIRLIPFEVTIPEGERDHKLLEKLQAELPGILHWAVQGCLEWQKNGLQPPKEVLAATSSYRREMDLVGDFIESCCIKKPQAKTPAREIYQAYCQWSDQNGEYTIAQRRFGSRLAERGFQKFKSTGGRIVWVGIGLLDNSEAS